MLLPWILQAGAGFWLLVKRCCPLEPELKKLHCSSGMEGNHLESWSGSEEKHIHTYEIYMECVLKHFCCFPGYTK